MSDTYDRHTDTVSRTVWEAIRAWRVGNGDCSLLPWIDAPNAEKAGLIIAVSGILAKIDNNEGIQIPIEPTVEDVLTVNIIYALAGE